MREMIFGRIFAILENFRAAKKRRLSSSAEAHFEMISPQLQCTADLIGLLKRAVNVRWQTCDPMCAEWLGWRGENAGKRLAPLCSELLPKYDSLVVLHSDDQVPQAQPRPPEGETERACAPAWRAIKIGT